MGELENAVIALFWVGEKPKLGSLSVTLPDKSSSQLLGDRDELLSKMADEFPEIPVVIITAAANESSAVKCMELGAFDYVIKPLEEAPLVAAINQAMSFRKMNSVNKSK